MQTDCKYLPKNQLKLKLLGKMKLVTVLVLFIVIVSVQSQLYIVTLGDAAAQCGDNQKIYCFNKGNSAGSLVDGLLGGNCSPSPIDLSIIDITELGIEKPISTACSNQVACCTGDQNGLLNLACTNLNL